MMDDCFTRVETIHHARDEKRSVRRKASGVSCVHFEQSRHPERPMAPKAFRLSYILLYGTDKGEGKGTDGSSNTTRRRVWDRPSHCTKCARVIPSLDSSWNTACPSQTRSRGVQEYWFDGSNASGENGELNVRRQMPYCSTISSRMRDPRESLRQIGDETRGGASDGSILLPTEDRWAHLRPAFVESAEQNLQTWPTRGISNRAHRGQERHRRDIDDSIDRWKTRPSDRFDRNNCPNPSSRQSKVAKIGSCPDTVPTVRIPRVSASQIPSRAQVVKIRWQLAKNQEKKRSWLRKYHSEKKLPQHKICNSEKKLPIQMQSWKEAR